MKITITIETEGDSARERELHALTGKLARDDTRLADAVAAAGGTLPPTKGNAVAKLKDANSVLDALAAQIATNASVVDSAIQFIGGVKAQIDAAVATALAGGATAAQLAPFTDLSAAMAAKDQALADAIAANTPATPPTP